MCSRLNECCRPVWYNHRMGGLEIEIQRLITLDGIGTLAEIARAEGFRMVDRLRREWADGTQCFNHPGEQLFGAYVSGQLVGIGGVTRQDATTGRVRRVYVLPDFRRRGVATVLLQKVIELSRGHFSLLVLHTDNPDASFFYEANGFTRLVGEQPTAITHRLSLEEARSDNQFRVISTRIGSFVQSHEADEP